MWRERGMKDGEGEECYMLQVNPKVAINSLLP